MKVQELLTNIKNEDFILEKSLEVKKYLPLEVKKTIAKGIMYDCTNDEDGVIKVDSVQKHVSYIRYMIITHTNLEYTDEDYDALCSTEYGYTTLLNAIIGTFEDDANECSRILNLMMDDYMKESTIEFVVAKFLNGIHGTVDNFVGAITKKIDGLDLGAIIPDNVDMDRLGAFLQSYIK